MPVKKSKFKFTNPVFNYAGMLHDHKMNPSQFAREILGVSPQSFLEMINRGTATYGFIRKLEDKLNKSVSKYIITP
jgi:hypothetical protein